VRTTVFRRQNSRFRKRFLEIGLVPALRSLIRILHASLVQTDTEMTKKYSNQRYAVHTVCCKHQSNKAQCRKSWLFHTPLHSMPPLEGFPSEYRHPVWHGKTRMAWLPDGEKNSKISLFVLTQLTNVTDEHTHRRTDTAWQHRPRLCIASRGKNRPIFSKLRTNIVWHVLYGPRCS